MFVVAGASGHTGSVVADTLLGQKHEVRVIVRDAKKGEPWKKKGAEVAVAELEDTASLARAFTGAQGVYVLIPPRMASKDPLGENERVSDSIASAVRVAEIPHVVLLSSIGAQHAQGNGPIQSVHRAERDLLATGTALTAVRAAYFMENWGSVLGATEQGVLPTFLKADAKQPMVATADIGRTAATELVEGGRGSRIVELAGPQEYTPNDVAEAVSKTVGRPVRAQELPLDAVVPTFTGFGVSPQVAQLFREMFEGMAAGRIAWEGVKARSVHGKVTLEDTLRKLLGR